MDQDIFRAGLEPGGLTSGRQIKTLICYLISKYDVPVPKSVLITGLTSTGLVNYFNCSESFAELCSANIIEISDDGYIVTDDGRFVADTIYDEIPLVVRERAIDTIRQNMLLHNNAKQHSTLIEKLEDGYMIHCNLNDPNSVLFSLSLYAPNYEFVSKIRRNFIKNGEQIIYSIMEEMTKD